MLTVLAPETIDTIIDYLHSDKQSLFACSLTAKQWLPSSRYHIFSRVHLRPTNIESFLELIEAPLSKLPVMLRHLLVNGFSQSIIAAANPHAKEHIRRVTSRLQEVTYLRDAIMGLKEQERVVLEMVCQVAAAMLEDDELARDLFYTIWRRPDAKRLPLGLLYAGRLPWSARDRRPAVAADDDGAGVSQGLPDRYSPFPGPKVQRSHSLQCFQCRPGLLWRR